MKKEEKKSRMELLLLKIKLELFLEYIQKCYNSVIRQRN